MENCKKIPICSIIIAVCNKADFLDEFWKCLQEQNLANKEVVWIDDCSQDHSLEKCLSFAGISSADPAQKSNEKYDLWQKDNITVIHLKQNSGPSVARRVGIENATGEYIACADPDDLIDAGMYDELYQDAQENNADVVWENYYTGKRDRPPILTEQVYPEDATEMINVMFYGRTDSGTWNKIFRRSFAAAHNVNFVDERLIVCEDLLFMVNYMRYLPKLHYHNGAHYHHIFYPVTLSHSRKNQDHFVSIARVGEILKSWSYPEKCIGGVRFEEERLKVILMLSPECPSRTAFQTFPDVKKVSAASAGGRTRKVLFDLCFCGMRPLVLFLLRSKSTSKAILKNIIQKIRGMC